MTYSHAPPSSAMAAEPGTHNSGQVHLSMKVGLHFAWATSEGCAEKHEREEEEEEEGSL